MAGALAKRELIAISCRVSRRLKVYLTHQVDHHPLLFAFLASATATATATINFNYTLPPTTTPTTTTS
jgi:hypothetical protein